MTEETKVKKTRVRRTAQQRAADLRAKAEQAEAQAALDSIEDPEVKLVFAAQKRVRNSLNAAESVDARKALAAALKPLDAYVKTLNLGAGTES